MRSFMLFSIGLTIISLGLLVIFTLYIDIGWRYMDLMYRYPINTTLELEPLIDIPPFKEDVYLLVMEGVPVYPGRYSIRGPDGVNVYIYNDVETIVVNGSEEIYLNNYFYRVAVLIPPSNTVKVVMHRLDNNLAGVPAIIILTGFVLMVVGVGGWKELLRLKD